ncbi:50S ribosomal protein L25 [Gemmatimonadetes bacterium T265]|nr:50S ribosomal protein L25 [Gemmatimonadetes bacterium T265]
MATATLGAEPRDGTGKGVARKLRAAGRVPAVVYGHARAPQSLSVGARELGRLLDQYAAASTVVELGLGGGTVRTLIREVQRHPVDRSLVHVDFLELVAGERVTVRVPLVFVGTAVGVRDQGGLLAEQLREIEVSADPANLPDRLEVDVTALTMGHPLHVRDIPVPNGVTVTSDPDAPVVSVTAPAEEESTEPTGTEDAAGAPVVLREKSADE